MALLGVNEVWKLDRFANKEDRGVVADLGKNLAFVYLETSWVTSI